MKAFTSVFVEAGTVIRRTEAAVKIGDVTLFFDDDAEITETIDVLEALREAMRARARLPETVGAQ